MIEAAGQRGPEAGQVRAAVFLRDIIGKTEDVFLVGIVPLHGQLDAGMLFIRLNINHGLMQRGLVAVQMPDKGADTALVFKRVRLAATLIQQFDPNTGVQKGELAQAPGQDVVVKFKLPEHRLAGQKANLGAGLVRGLTAF